MVLITFKNDFKNYVPATVACVIVIRKKKTMQYVNNAHCKLTIS